MCKECFVIFMIYDFFSPVAATLIIAFINVKEKKKSMGFSVGCESSLPLSHLESHLVYYNVTLSLL